MIIYYDVLLVDEESLLAVRHSDRFRRLARLVIPRQGHAELVDRLTIDFTRSSAAAVLRKEFARCIKEGSEGLVLKPDDHYFDFSGARRSFRCMNIKMKKEYIGGFGDVGDFAVVGAHYDAKKAKAYKCTNVRWTHFFVGCIDNRAEAKAGQEKPSFIVTNVVELGEVHLKTLLAFADVDTVNPEQNEAIGIRLESTIAGGRKLSAVFRNPPVFDIRCFAFDVVGNTGFWSPRFPTVSKIHFDRTYLDTISFAELQDMAEKARQQAAPDDSQELLGWITALERADPRGIAVDANSQQTEATGRNTCSPASSYPAQRPLSFLSATSLSTAANRTKPAPLTPPTSSATEPSNSNNENDAVVISQARGSVLGKRSRDDRSAPRPAKPPSPVKRSRTDLAESGDGCSCHCHRRRRTHSI